MSSEKPTTTQADLEREMTDLEWRLFCALLSLANETKGRGVKYSDNSALGRAFGLIAEMKKERLVA